MSFCYTKNTNVSTWSPNPYHNNDGEEFCHQETRFSRFCNGIGSEESEGRGVRRTIRENPTVFFNREPFPEDEDGNGPLCYCPSSYNPDDNPNSPGNRLRSIDIEEELTYYPDEGGTQTNQPITYTKKQRLEFPMKKQQNTEDSNNNNLREQSELDTNQTLRKSDNINSSPTGEYFYNTRTKEFAPAEDVTIVTVGKNSDSRSHPLQEAQSSKNSMSKALIQPNRSNVPASQMTTQAYADFDFSPRPQPQTHQYSAYPNSHHNYPPPYNPSINPNSFMMGTGAGCGFPMAPLQQCPPPALIPMCLPSCNQYTSIPFNGEGFQFPTTYNQNELAQAYGEQKYFKTSKKSKSKHRKKEKAKSKSKIRMHMHVDENKLKHEPSPCLPEKSKSNVHGKSKPKIKMETVENQLKNEPSPCLPQTTKPNGGELSKAEIKLETVENQLKSEPPPCLPQTTKPNVIELSKGKVKLETVENQLKYEPSPGVPQTTKPNVIELSKGKVKLETVENHLKSEPSPCLPQTTKPNVIELSKGKVKMEADENKLKYESSSFLSQTAKSIGSRSTLQNIYTTPSSTTLTKQTSTIQSAPNYSSSSSSSWTSSSSSSSSTFSGSWSSSTGSWSSSTSSSSSNEYWVDQIPFKEIKERIQLAKSGMTVCTESQNHVRPAHQKVHLHNVEVQPNKIPEAMHFYSETYQNELPALELCKPEVKKSSSTVLRILSKSLNFVKKMMPKLGKNKNVNSVESEQVSSEYQE